MAAPTEHGPPEAVRLHIVGDGSGEQEAKGAELSPLQQAFADSSGGIRRMLEMSPPERAWLVRDLLPERCVGLLVAAGGTGKGHAEMQLGLSVALGIPFACWSVPRPRGVLIISREDDHDELHRRLYAAIQARMLQGLSERDRELLERNLRFVDLVGVPNATLEGPLISAVVEAVDGMEDCGLVVADPLGKLLPTDVECSLNSQEGAGVLHTRLDQILRQTGCAVLAAHHVSKASRRDGKQLDATAATGSSMLVDLSRFALSMASVERKRIEELGLDPSASYVELTPSKSNYAPSLPEPVLWRRSKGGALVHVRNRPRGEIDADRVLEALRDLGEPSDRVEWEAACKALEPPIGQHRARAARVALVKSGRVRSERESQESADGGRPTELFSLPEGF